jgi:hypothetical protein
MSTRRKRKQKRRVCDRFAVDRCTSLPYIAFSSRDLVYPCLLLPTRCLPVSICVPALLSPSSFPSPIRSQSLACAEMVLLCEPLCHFGDRYIHAHFLHIQPNQRNSNRLYFTTFPHPLLPSDILNSLATESGNRPRVRPRPKVGVPSSATPDDDASYYYFTVDDKLVYMSFFQDWGPLNIAMVYKACILIHELLEVNSSHPVASPDSKYCTRIPN